MTTATRTTTSTSSTGTPATKTLGRSGIHHNILGAFNTMILDDIVGIRPRLDDTVELWPIDVGWDHYAVNNLSYHGADLTIVLDRAGDGRSLLPAPEGMSLYVNGKRVLTVDDTARVSWNSATGEGRVLDGSSATVRFARAESPDRGARGRPGSQRARRRHVPEGRRRPVAGGAVPHEPGQGPARQRLVHDHVAVAAGHGARARGRRLHDQRPAGAGRAATSRATRSGAPRARRTPRTGSRSISARSGRSTR